MMFKVTFKAEIAELDDEYFTTANRLRELALTEYGCISFESTTEGNREIAVSYWPSQDAIMAWRENEEHKFAQSQGKSKWYKSYEIANISTSSADKKS